MGKMLVLIHADPFGYSDRGYSGQTVPILFVLVPDMFPISHGYSWLNVPGLWACCFVVFLCPGCGLEFIYDWYAG